MTLTALDIPQDLQCGVIDQDWINLINDWRQRSFAEIFSVQNDLNAFRTEINASFTAFTNEINQEISQIRQDLPRIAFNEISPRFYTVSVRKFENITASITLPAGGTYYGQFTVNVAEEGVPMLGKNYLFGEGNTDDDRSVNGTLTGSFSGGYTESLSGDVEGVMSFFGFRRD